MAGRIALFDNVKGFAILMVVLGHLCTAAYGIFHLKRLAVAFTFIYAFHIPLFLFCAGLFAGASWTKTKRMPWGNVLTYLVIYLVFWAALALFNIAVDGHAFAPNPLFMHKAPWFMLVLLLHMLFVPFLGSLRPAPGVAVCVLGALAANWLIPTPDFLASGRAFTYLPYFALGFYLQPQRVTAFVDAAHKRLGSVLPHLIGIAGMLVVIAALFHLSKHDLNMFKSVCGSIHSMSYYLGHYGIGAGMFVAMRLGGYLLACFIGLCAVLAVPRGECALSLWGRRSLQVYVIHIFIIYALNRVGFYHLLAVWSYQPGIGPLAPYAVFPIGLALTWLLALPAAPERWVAALSKKCKALTAPRAA